MANIKVGDKVQITKGALSGTFWFVRDILRGSLGSSYLLSYPPHPSFCWVCSYQDGEIQKVGV